MVPSSSGPGRQVFILNIAGSIPAGITKFSLFRGDPQGSLRCIDVSDYIFPKLVEIRVQVP